jgi:predicted nucleic acid-binding Zn ribbon protein
MIPCWPFDSTISIRAEQQLAAVAAPRPRALSLYSVHAVARRARAQEMRALGDQMHDQLAREGMLQLANKYERLADWAQERSRLSAR